ncbi:hybrid sensor histidine kinase/response regulator [Leptolyngbya sp. CCNP1308]|uniref:hybrid sensor histidine kinase/response regulator n=1 Tax=Leptolyngbya sp. CCNP1308 TaxID=3110255 RepID=UPI002B20701E|nr:hybrid sensor histidine kinase/response regulator [Leptolyngbya sp. CCNP1308]MEA5452671.1 hybrid sensor histidine kinase/response regulator [Leptolyngbya sp. CCNP1308]
MPHRRAATHHDATMMIDDAELRDIFKAASEEHLQALDDGLLHLEQHPDDLDTLANLMREAHSLKGDGNMLGVTDLGKVAHQIEHIFGAISRREQFPCADLFDRLAHGIAAMRQIVQVAVTGEPTTVQVFYVLAKLMGAETTASAPVSDPVVEVDDAIFAPAIAGADFEADAVFAPAFLEIDEPLNGSQGTELVAPLPAEGTGLSDRYITDSELRDIFKTASAERLQALDDGLLKLENHPDDLALLDGLMREAHSLKGDGNMLGVTDLGKIAHHLEQILGDLKRGEAVLSADLCDRLAHGLTAMKQLVHEATTGEPTGVNLFYVLAELMGAPLSPQPPTPAATAIATAPPKSQNSPDLCPEPPPEPVLPTPSPPHPSPSPPDPDLTQSADYRIETIRVPTQSLDALMTQSGELTVTKIRVAHRLAEIDAITNLWEEWSRDFLMNRFLLHDAQQGKPVWQQLDSFQNRTEQHLEQLGTLVQQLSSALHADTARLETITDGLEEGIRTLRLLPLSTLFNLFPRLVRDLARQEGKQVQLLIEGGDTRVDKRILEEMKDPLLHMIHNAIDHGIESPAERLRQGKPEVATITLRGYRTSTRISIEVSDDGRGLNVESIKQAAVRRGLYRPEELELLTPAQIQGLILSQGFSSRTLVTEISGRGVGLDVLRTNVERLKGSIDIQSTPGEGCTLRIQLGTTLATAHVLLVAAGGQTFALPAEYVETACLVQASEIFTLEGHDTILRDDRPVSVVWLSDLLNLPRAEPKQRGRSQQSDGGEPPQRRLACMILQSGPDRLGVFIEALLDEQEVVLKPQSQLLKRVRYIAGATILGTGDVCMVLNPQDLIAAVRDRGRSPSLPAVNLDAAEAQDEARPRCILLVEDSIATRTQEKRILESAGYEVVTAVDGLDGFNKLRSRPFDAVVSDVQMPNLDGLGLTQRIRQQREYSELPVVLVTTLASEDDRRRGAEAGANAYITKGSFTQDLLFETLNRLI